MPERCHSWLGGFYIYSAQRFAVTLFVTAGNWPCSVSVFNKQRLQISLSMGEGESVFQSILVVAFKISFLRKRKQIGLQLLLRRPCVWVRIHRDEQSWGQEERKKLLLRDLQLLSPISKSPACLARQHRIFLSSHLSWPLEVVPVLSFSRHLPPALPFTSEMFLTELPPPNLLLSSSSSWGAGGLMALLHQHLLPHTKHKIGPGSSPGEDCSWFRLLCWGKI